MAIELSAHRWRLCFGDGHRRRDRTIEASDLAALEAEMARAKAKFGLPASAVVVSCYEAGREGFWLHRWLCSQRVSNVVVDSASIEVDRRRRRAKSDHIDARALEGLLERAVGGERRALRVVRVPSVAAEDERRLLREREYLVAERGRHSARMKSLLHAHGIRVADHREWRARLEELTSPAGYRLGPRLRAELRREYARYRLVCEQIAELEAELAAMVNSEADSPVIGLVRQLQALRGVGLVSSWTLVLELFGWRVFANRRELGALSGLRPTPYQSGDSAREQGISKAGNRRVRRVMLELAWGWLRHQPTSALTLWFQRRFGAGGKRLRRVGIVALARKLLVALWRYLHDGEIPEGTVLTAA
ncbi:IS110 family transposase [Arhodomonas sp. AD133]|uniref:IS110 family transposase n=1 Tax=Arhodomonas sp. AD133 TaxID=3415009 RepID=UPI003EBA61D1